MNFKRIMNLKKNFKNINFDKTIGRNGKKYAFFFALSAFTMLNTGFTAQPTSELPVDENKVQVAEVVDSAPSEQMARLIAEESKHLPSKITVSDSGSLSLAENDEQRLLLAEVVSNTMAKVEKVEDMQGIAEGEAIEEPEFIEEHEEISNVSNLYDRDGSVDTSQYASVMSMEATAYLPTDGSGTGMTATGIPATYGVVAVDPGVIPLGTRLYIPGYGEAVAADTGGAINGYKIDLCMESYEECMNFGRRTITVYVLQ